MSQTPAHHPALVDTHAHLDGNRFRDDLDQVLERATEQGVRTIITVGCDLPSSVASVELAQRFSQLYATVGIHPHDASTLTPEVLARLAQLAGHERVVAVGEIGLDYFRNRSPQDVQQQAFRQQIQLARQYRKPIVIHDRDAHEDILRILKEELADDDLGVVLHCFSGDLAMAEECVKRGYYLSFTGTITYPKNDAMREIIRQIPLERILVETDCPYLSPQSWRGQRNEPAYVVETARAIATLRGLTLHDIARITSLNCFRLFGVGQVDQSAKIAYRIRNALYLNITNRCTNHCVFCAKFRDFEVKGHQLKLDHEPDAKEIIQAIGDPTAYEEVVFCGYGEPLLRLETVIEVARWLKQQGIRVRINSDGQANLVHGRNILPELEGLVDSLSISLNAPFAEQYQQLCHSRFGEQGFEAVKEFLRQAPHFIPEVVASAVTVPGVNIEACAKLADELGVTFRKRIYNDVG
ncbi:MAG: YchF/TatD family DNA exonuclease [Desulfuromonadaceae bacterium]|nr:YchF/TatD family DNA exonuclease [Desulfuromonadaceae bacterium]